LYNELRRKEIEKGDIKKCSASEIDRLLDDYEQGEYYQLFYEEMVNNKPGEGSGSSSNVILEIGKSLRPKKIIIIVNFP
jgi:hypothetical protein